MEDKNYGYVKIKLAKLIKDRKISKNKLSHRAEMQRSQINHYCNEEITRLDTAVLARLCTALDCKIEDLLEFVPKENTKDSSS
jgi:putative transcriptional regulator